MQKKEWAAAFTHMHTAARSGHTGAQSALGRMYLEGLGTPVDPLQAKYWLHKAAEKHFVDALTLLGNMYVSEQSAAGCTEGVHFLRQAAQRDDDSARMALWKLYAAGICVEQNAEKSTAYAAQLSNLQMKSLVTAQQLFWGVNNTVKDHGTAINLFTELYEQYPAVAGYALGVAYHLGTGVEKNAQTAFTYFLTSAEAGNAASQLSASIALYKGIGTEKDVQQSMYWAAKAAAQNQPVALRVMGQAYENGITVERDAETARKFYRKAAALGDTFAQKMLDKTTIQN